MSNEIFQKVYDMIHPFLPKGWKKMVLYVGYTTGSYSMKYYISDKDGMYTDCFSQKEISKAQIIKLFMDVDKILASERKTLDDKSRWSVMTMIVEADGNMRTDFEYSDISENVISYEQSWKDKYLK